MTDDNQSQQPPTARGPTVTDDERQELVAYLDGEIEGADRLRIEQRLGTDAEYRRRLVELEQSWNLLDTLPLAQADAKFTESTVTMAAAVVQAEARSWWHVRSWWLLGLTAVLGFVLVGVPLAAQRRARLRDVPVIHNIDLYLHADSLEFLQMLADEGVFAEVDDDVL